jgi:hypothetical protein
MNGPTRKKIYTELSKNGELCQFCGRTSDVMQLVIDHIDNNNVNNNPENLRLLCRRCNYIKNPRRPVDECVNENVHEEMSELQTSHTKKPLFRRFVWHEINELEEIPEKNILDSVAEELDMSQVTAKRWLDAMCSSRGALERITRVKTTIVRMKHSDVFS